MKPLFLLLLISAAPVAAAPLSVEGAQAFCALAARGSLVVARAGNDVPGMAEAMVFCIESGMLKEAGVAAAAADFNAVAKPLD